MTIEERKIAFANELNAKLIELKEKYQLVIMPLIDVVDVTPKDATKPEGEDAK